jgi:hypothetical protein
MSTPPPSSGKMKELSRFCASYYAGLTIEADPDPDPSRLKLAIDGHRIPIKKVGDSFVYSKGDDSTRSGTLSAPTLSKLSKKIIDTLWDRKKRKETRQAHLAELGKGLDSWNKWRREHPEIRPLLFNAPLCGENLNDYNMCNANLIQADLRDAELINTNFHEANLGGAKLNRAKLIGANFCRTDLYETDLSEANLTGANLQGTQLARTNFRDARLIGCTIYGLSAWNLQLKKAEQKGLRILYKVQQANREWDEGEFPVPDLEVAQFAFLLLDNTRINNFFNTMTSKAVLIMGRFQPKARKTIIDGLRRNLRKAGFLPIVFDFDRPTDRDFAETIKTLVGLCQFAIVDITNPRSTPLELDATVKDYQVPFVPIIQKGKKPFSMFNDLQKYGWMLKTLTYESPANLSRVTKPLIIDRALKVCNEIRGFKARRETDELSAQDYIDSDRARRKMLEGVLR